MKLLPVLVLLGMASIDLVSADRLCTRSRRTAQRCARRRERTRRALRNAVAFNRSAATRFSDAALTTLGSAS
ncbi:hypothetical protein V8E36_009395, partial [Tilletia maclaganii]